MELTDKENLLIENSVSCQTEIAIPRKIINQANHKSICRSQPVEERFYLGNVRLSACVLFSSSSYRKLEKYFHILNIPGYRNLVTATCSTIW